MILNRTPDEVSRRELLRSLGAGALAATFLAESCSPGPPASGRTKSRSS
jgi:hypothetical protein